MITILIYNSFILQFIVIVFGVVMKFSKLLLGSLLSIGVLATAPLAWAQSNVINVYSARHYPSDDVLYSGFTKKTGIKIQRVDSDDAGILNRLKVEASSSPADVILLVDAARLWKAESDGLFLPIQSKLLADSIPDQFHSEKKPEGYTWFGFSNRARVVVYNKTMFQAQDLDTYEKLADPKLKGKLCTRSGSHPYNLSLFGSMYEHMGAEKTENWLKGMVANMARNPKGGDTDQIKAVASGECGVALTNTYYFARLLRSNNPEEKAIAEKVGLIFPNQKTWGTHLNIAGGAVAKHSKNSKQAIMFLEYLATPEAQNHFANGNNEWPTVKGVSFDNPALKAMAGSGFLSETIAVNKVGMNQAKVQQMLDRVGYK